jgi:hypothetical protein
MSSLGRDIKEHEEKYDIRIRDNGSNTKRTVLLPISDCESALRIEDEGESCLP